MSTNPTSAPAQKFSYQKALSVLSDNEQKRLFCLWLTCSETIKPSPADLKIAAEQFGNKPSSFQVLYYNTMKKLRNENAYIVEGEQVDDETAMTPTVQGKGTPKKAVTPRKRKVITDKGETGAKKKRAVKVKDEEKVKVEEDGGVDANDGAMAAE